MRYFNYVDILGGVTMVQIQGLSLDDKIIGLRFKTNNGVFDADRESLRKLGVHNLRVPQVEKLRHFGNFLMTQEEFESDLYTEDISESPKLQSIVKALSESEKFAYMFRYLRPYEQDVEEFLISGWLPQYEQRNDEYNGQHNLFLPDGSRYRGGWIGKGRTFEIVLRQFHYEQCFWFIHKGGTPHPDAIKTYNDLKRYNDIISDIKEKIKVRIEQNGQNKVTTSAVPQLNNEAILLDAHEYVKLSPYQQRGFFTHADFAYFGYPDKNIDIPSPPKSVRSMHVFDLRELLLVAYLRKFYEVYRYQPELVTFTDK